MPFGIRNPYSYVSKIAEMYPVENYDSCPVCGKDLTSMTKGDWSPVGPVVVPKNVPDDYPKMCILACQSCYQANYNRVFNRIEDLIAYRRSGKRRNRVAGTRDATILDEMKSTDDIKLELIYESLGKLEKEFKELRKLLSNFDAGPAQKSSAPVQCDNETDAPGAPLDDLDDDLEAGMTPEQRARMLAAVAVAEARDGKVPEEAHHDIAKDF